MSSIMRRRNGLIALSVMEVLLSWERLWQPLDHKTGRFHPATAVLSPHPLSPALPRQRFSATKRYGTSWPQSLRLDAGGLDHLGPLLGFLGDELSELDWCHRQRHTADFGQARYHFGITQHGIHFAIELLDDVSGRILGHPYAVP